MAYAVAPLPYDYAALAPTIDAETMKLHHDKHHQTYVDNLNKALGENATLAAMSLDQLQGAISKAPAAIRNNGGGHWNHSFFWEIMAPAASAGQPSQGLRAAIDTLGGMDKLKADFKTAGTGRFGSGWVWLSVAGDGALKISSTPNQDNPLMDAVEDRGQPILGNDVWEHAYYLTYNNRRADYLDAWWNVVNWAEVSRRFEAAKS